MIKSSNFKWLVCGLLITCIFKVHAQTSKKMNVMFFLIDDLGYTDIEPFGSKFYETPNLNKLAAESMKFTNAYAACPVCSPTRASIMTGKYPARTQNTDWFGAAEPDEIKANVKKATLQKLLPAPYLKHLELEEITIGEAFKQNGYTTFFAGKWHLGETAKYWPLNQGFDINKGGNNLGHPPSYFVPYRNVTLPDGPKGEYITDRLADETVDFIDKHKSETFFSYFSMYAVHTPIQAKKEMIEKYQKKKEKLGITDDYGMEGASKFRKSQGNVTYAAMVESMDQAVGKVIQKLKDEGIYDNTIIVFFSDNGGEAFADERPTANLPLRAGKGWLYEGGIREPMMVRWPGHTKAGSVTNSQVLSTDFYPTLLQMNNLPLLPKQHVDGTSFVAVLNGKSVNRAPMIWHYPHYGNQGGAPGSAIIDGKWKLIRWYEGNREELFNIQDDISEKNECGKTYPAIVSKLRAELDQSLKDQNALMPTVNPNYKP